MGPFRAGIFYGSVAVVVALATNLHFKLYHAGDTDLFGDMQLIGDLHRPDIAILPIGDRLTMGPREAAHAARLLGVRHVIPVHYDTNVIPVFTGTPAEFRKQLDAIAPGVTMHDLKPGDHLSS